jgi:hypothetical protein
MLVCVHQLAGGVTTATAGAVRAKELCELCLAGLTPYQHVFLQAGVFAVLYSTCVRQLLVAALPGLRSGCDSVMRLCGMA